MENITIRRERLCADEYIDFLKRTDLGSQYPKERFHERIEKLVKEQPETAEIVKDITANINARYE